MIKKARELTMKILITGGSGFIGQNLIHALIKKEDIEIFSLSKGQVHFSGATAIQCDILEQQKVERLFQKIHFDVVIHLAAITEHYAIVDDRFKTFQTNLQGTINLLECFNRYCEGGLFLYSSTGKVYGDTNEMPISETARIFPKNILGKTKHITEQIIDFYAEPKNQYLICRIFNIYGEHQKRSFVVPTIIDQLDEPVLKLGALEDQRDYLYIDDLIAALITCIQYRQQFASVDYVNIGSGQPACVADILHEIEILTGKKIKVHIEQSKLRTDETPLEYCSHEKLTKLTGWVPAFTLQTGLKKTLQNEGVIV